MNHSFQLNIITTDGIGTIVASTDEASVAVTIVPLLKVFSFSEKSGLPLFHCVDPALRARVGEYLAPRVRACPELQRLAKKIRDQPDGAFIGTMVGDLSSELRFYFESAVEKLNGQGLAPEVMIALSGVVGDVLKAYDMFSPRTDRTTWIGAKDPKARRCRYCSKTKATGATFKTTAHAIPESLGNVHVKLRDECDECNCYFATRTENAIASYLALQRAHLGIEGKNGFPKLHFKQGALVHHEGTMVIKGKRSDGSTDDEFVIELGEGQQAFATADCYKAFVRMVVSVIDDKYLKALEPTIRWLRYNEYHDVELPPVMTTIMPRAKPDDLMLIVHVRRPDADPDLPYIVGEFRLGCYVYVFAVPHLAEDREGILGFFERPAFKNTFKHYGVAVWTPQQLDSYVPANHRLTLRLVRNTEPESVMTS